jgi:hypothetical protein
VPRRVSFRAGNSTGYLHSISNANCIWHLGGIALEHAHHDSARKTFEDALPRFPKVAAEAIRIQSLGDSALARSEVII